MKREAWPDSPETSRANPFAFSFKKQKITTESGTNITKKAQMFLLQNNNRTLFIVIKSSTSYLCNLGKNQKSNKETK